MKLLVRPLRGPARDMDVPADVTVEGLEALYAKHTEGASATMSRLVHAGKVLPRGTLLTSCGVGSGDCVILLSARPPAPPPTKDMTPPPGAEDIGIALAAEMRARRGGDAAPDAANMETAEAAEETAEERNLALGRMVPGLSLATQLQSLVSTVLGLDSMPGASGDQEGEPGTVPEPDPAVVTQLTDMGFAEARARKALQLCRGNINAAMEWMLEHELDPDVDAPLTEEQLRTIAQQHRPLVLGRLASSSPNPQAVDQLVEMGFAREDAEDALRLAGNNEEFACEMLLRGSMPRQRRSLGQGASRPSDSAEGEALLREVLDHASGLETPRMHGEEHGSESEEEEEDDEEEEEEEEGEEEEDEDEEEEEDDEHIDMMVP